VGPCVVQALHQAGYKIRTFSIDTPSRSIFPQDIEIVTGDITDYGAVKSAMQGVDAVVHMAALLHIVNPSPDLHDKYERINVGGTEKVVEAAMKANVCRVVLFSTIAVYGQSHGQALEEQSPTNPDTYYAKTKLAAEKIVLNTRDDHGKPLGTVLRLGAIYGERVKGNYEKLLQALAKGWFIPIGNGNNRRTLVYDKDVSQAAVLAVSHSLAAGNVYNVSDGQFHTMNEIIFAMCNALGKTVPRFSLPSVLVRKIAGIVEDGSRMLGIRSPIGRSSIDKYTEDIAVESKRIQSQLGFVPKYDLISGWQQAVEYMRKMGDL